MNTRCRYQLIAAVVFLFTASGLVTFVHGQTASATLSGTVQDERGAVIPGAQITITNPATTLERQVVTNESGFFIIPLLPPATYSVTVQSQGFSPVKVPNVVLNVGDQKALQIQLKAGDVNAEVTIDSDAETVRTDGSVGTVVNRQFVANIPLNGRSLQALIQLTPGVVLTESPGGPTGSQQFSVNGQRTTANYFMVDGVSANTGIEASALGVDPGASASGQTAGTTVLGTTNSLVSLDALQEFRIETSSYAAEYGRTPGGQISLVTRSGDNKFTGSASYYIRNEALDANDWFANANRLARPIERQNFFGGVLSGPVYLPRFGEGGRKLWSGKDRLFFFASYEGLRLRQPRVVVTTVASNALRSQAAPVFQPFLKALPVPNGQDFGDGTALFAGSYSDSGSFNIFGLRLDGHLTDRLTAFFRFNHAPSELNSRDPVVPSVINRTQAQNNSYTGGATWVSSPGMTADLRINWTRNAAPAVSDLDTFGGAVIPAVSDWFGPGRNPSNSRFRFFTFLFGVISWGAGSSDVQRQWNAVGTVGVSIGSHQLKVGVDYRRLLPLLGRTGNIFENFQINTAKQIRDGVITNDRLDANVPIAREPQISNLSLFVQDTWHANRRLTLTYGLRFERVPSPGEATGQLPRTLLGIESSILQNPRLAPAGTPLFHNRFGEFGPRFGAAYQLSTRSRWETTVRGGAGIFYDLGLGDIANAFAFAYPFFAEKVVCCNLPLPLSAASRALPLVPATAPDPTSNLFSITALAPNLRLPYAIEWNGAIEQAIGSGQTVTASYVGAAGRRLLGQDVYSTALADFPGVSANINIQRNLGRSSYHALQIQFQRRLVRNLQALASYTLGRSEDDASTDERDITAAPSSQASLSTRNWGVSNFDVRHILSAGVTYNLPGLSGPTVVRALSRDWGLDLLFRYQSAFPVNPVFTGVFLADGTILNPRPNLISGVPLYVNDPTAPGGRRFNTSTPTAEQIAAAGCVPSNGRNAKGALCAPPSGQQGNFPRNGLRGFPASQIDLALRREFRLGEVLRLQLRGELFNLFNHPNFGPPRNLVNSGAFGRVSQMRNQALGGLNGLYQMGGPRSGQLALKLIW
jgi:hypothetical protein